MKNGTDITIPGFSNLTKQQIVEMGVAHVLANGRPSMADGSCKYGGIGCAAAPLINPLYRDAVDGIGAWMDLYERDLVPDHMLETVSVLQSCHDEAAEDVGDLIFDDEAMDDLHAVTDEGIFPEHYNVEFLKRFRDNIKERFSDLTIAALA